MSWTGGMSRMRWSPSATISCRKESVLSCASIDREARVWMARCCGTHDPETHRQGCCMLCLWCGVHVAKSNPRCTAWFAHPCVHVNKNRRGL